MYANRFLPTVQRDERITPLLENMHTMYTGQKYGAGHSVRRPAATFTDFATACDLPASLPSHAVSG